MSRLPAIMPSNRTKQLEIAAIILIFALAAGLRFWGIRFGFPEHTRPDEQYFVNAIQRFDRLGTLDPDWFYYPSFYMYVNLAVWRAYAFVELLRGHYVVPNPSQRQPTTYGLEQIRARAPDIDFLLGRCVTAVFGVATVAVVYFFTRKFYGRKAAVAAGLLLAVNSLHVLNSHFYKSDVATTFFTMAALACMAMFVECSGRRKEADPQLAQDRTCLTVLNGPTGPTPAIPEGRLSYEGGYSTGGYRWNILAAICSGLAASTNYYGGFVFVPLIAAQFMARYEKQESFAKAIAETGRAIRRTFCGWQFYAIPLIAVAVFAATSPYCFLRWTAFREAFHRMLLSDRQSLYDTMVKQADFNDYWFQTSPLAYSLLFCWGYSMGFYLSLAAAIGVGYLAIRGKFAGWLLLLFLITHFFMITTGKAIFMRYYLSLVPILAIATGAMLSCAATETVPGKRPASPYITLAGLLIWLGTGSLLSSVQQDRLLAKKDTRIEAREWLAKNLPANALVGTPMDWWGDYYPYGKPTLPGGRRYIPIKPDAVKSSGVRYVLIDDYGLRLYSNHPDWRDWEDTVLKWVFEASPYSEVRSKSQPQFDQLDAFYLPLSDFGQFTRPGPRIRVYEVAP